MSLYSIFLGLGGDFLMGASVPECGVITLAIITACGAISANYRFKWLICNNLNRYVTGLLEKCYWLNVVIY